MRRTQGIVQYIVVNMRYIQLVRVSIQTNNNLQYTFHYRVDHFTDWLQKKRFFWIRSLSVYEISFVKDNHKCLIKKNI